METGIIIISTTLIVLCVLPFILIYGSTKQKEKQLKRGLIEAISKNNGILTESVINIDFAMGLDCNLKQIYFYKKTSETGYIQKINLNEVTSCEVKKEVKRVKNSKSNTQVIQSIALVFTHVDGQPFEEFELYNFDENPQFNGEIALADTWKKKVNDLIKVKSEILADNRKPHESLVLS